MIEKKEAKPVPCLVANVVRVVCGVDQGELARELRIDPRKVSARERHTKGTLPSREEILEAVRAMDRPEALVDLTYEYARNVSHLFTAKSSALEVPMRNASNQIGARVGQIFFDLATGITQQARTFLERQEADFRWRLFSKLPEPARREALQSEELFHSWAFAERLWLESLSAAADDAKRALELGELAVVVAERVKEDGPFKSRLLGLAWSAVANARRVESALLQAHETYAKAKKLWIDGEEAGAGILDAARFLAMESALRVDQRRFPEAEACIDAAFRAAKPGEDVVYLFIAKGNILLQLQRHEEATAIYHEAEVRMGPSTTPRERFSTHFNLTVCMIAMGRAEEAQAELPVLRRMAVAIGNGLDSIRVRWLEGQALAGLDRRDEAVEMLGEVQEVFLARRIVLDAARVSLERAALLLEEGKIAEVKREAPVLAEAFRSLEVAQDLLMALNLFWGAAQAERATAEQARLLLAQLRQAGGPPAPAA